MLENIISLFIPIGFCVVVPIAIVWIVFKTIMNKDNRRTEVLIEAIRSNNNIDTDKLAEAMTKSNRTPTEILNLRLLRGCMFSLSGIALLICSLIFNLNGIFILEIDPFLIIGSALLAIGISYMIVYFVTGKTIDAE